MGQSVRVAVIIPAGPRDDVLDTLQSVIHYLGSSRVVVVVDDTSNPNLQVKAQALSSDIVVIRAPAGAPGSQGGLWVKLAAGYRWVLERYNAELFLRLDADALVTGHGLEDAAEQAFKRNGRVGLLGSYRVGPTGGLRDFGWPARRLRAETGFRGLIHQESRRHLRSLLALARSNGYTDGENVLGASYIHSRQAVRAIHDRGWFDQPCLAASRLGEDHIMALVTLAAGYELHDFGAPDDPLAVSWRGLPAHPADLLAAGKLVVHSVRYWQDLGERDIRQTFADARARDHLGREGRDGDFNRLGDTRLDLA